MGQTGKIEPEDSEAQGQKDSAAQSAAQGSEQKASPSPEESSDALEAVSEEGSQPSASKNEEVPNPPENPVPASPKTPASKPSKGPSHAAHMRVPQKHSPLFYTGVAFGLCIAVGIVFAAITILAPFDVVVNGQRVTSHFGTTIQEVIESSQVEPKAGNLVAIDGSLIEEGGGEPYTVLVNGNHTDDFEARVKADDSIEVSDGEDVTEPFTEEEVVAFASADVDGKGAVHIISSEAQNGIQSVKTGQVSGISVSTEVQPPVNASCTRLNIDTQGAPVIALTFDDGPHAEHTPQVLDVLAQYGAHATFFTVGNLIEGEKADIVRRANSEGHQVTTHTFDHASGSGQGVNLGYMSPEEQVEEVQDGWQAIIDATGIEPSKYIRVPGGNFGENVIATLSPIIAGDIGWNIDTEDWKKPGVQAIKDQILSAEPGDIVLMHDGGGDRSQTVEALSQALPELVARGYQFVTIDELLGYLPDNSQ